MGNDLAGAASTLIKKVSIRRQASLFVSLDESSKSDNNFLLSQIWHRVPSSLP